MEMYIVVLFLLNLKFKKFGNSYDFLFMLLV